MISGTINEASSRYSRGTVLARVATAPDAIRLKPPGVPGNEWDTKRSFSWSESSEKISASPDFGRSSSCDCSVAIS